MREIARRGYVPANGSSGDGTLRVELGLRLLNIQNILVGDASQSSSSAKHFEGCGTI